MWRPITLTDQNSNVDVNGVTYNAANQLLTMTGVLQESRQYNSLGQLTQLSASGGGASINYSYNFPTGTNNGKISSAYNAVTGETITYQYDSLNRLTSAAGSGWSDAYGFDSFGNLASKMPTGPAPTLSQAANSATNEIVGQSYDLNGNQLTAPGVTGSVTYDAENRMVAAPGVQYAYDSRNKRVWSATLDSSGNLTSQTAYFYGIDGKKLASYTLTVSGTHLYDPPAETDVYFAGRRVYVNGAIFSEDRLGSNAAVSLYPWGEDQGTPAPNDQVKFATYTRDSATLLDYADQRYYVTNQGRFMTPDPYRGSGSPRNPQSWNRYGYAAGDPVNQNDPAGQIICDPDYGCGNGCDVFDVTCDGPPTCYEGDGVEPMPGPDCGGDGPEPPELPVPQCSISLYERSAGGKHRPWQHTYIAIYDPFLQQSGYPADELILQAGPSNNFPIFGTLTSEIAIPGTGLGIKQNNASEPGVSGNTEIGSPYTGANACLDIVDLLEAIGNYDHSKQVPYMAVPIPFFTYNSNSFTSTLLNDVGLSFGSPGFAPGWGPWFYVPGLVP
jgi:RHS repeat-associated protein